VTSTVGDNERIVQLQGGINFRDLGGYQTMSGLHVRWKQIFRSGTTHLLTDADRTRLLNLGIRSVVDLRSVKERDQYPHALLGRPGVDYFALDHDRAAGNVLKMLRKQDLSVAELHVAALNSYRNLPYESLAIFKQLFSSVAGGALPLVFNCSAGKDRTGVAAALLLSALGVAWEDTVSDYMLSQPFSRDIERAFRLPDAEDIFKHLPSEVVATVFRVDRLYIEAMRESLIERSGSIEQYLSSDLGLSAPTIERIRQTLLCA
jgi:protein-tyrosine phosphatase